MEGPIQPATLIWEIQDDVMLSNNIERIQWGPVHYRNEGKCTVIRKQQNIQFPLIVEGKTDVQLLKGC